MIICSTSASFGSYKGEDALCSDGKVLSLFHSSLGLQSITAAKDITKAYFNPHHPRHLSLVHKDSVSHHDSRTQTCEVAVEWDGVLDMDVNPCQAFQLCVSDREGRVVFFDTRNNTVPIRTTHHTAQLARTESQKDPISAREVMRTSQHSFWAGSVKYNLFHDQLVLSGGCDGNVNLHSCVSISSANVRALSTTTGVFDNVRMGSGLSVRVGDSESDDGEGEFGKPEDGLVKSYDLHEDSVNAVCWSVNDPWVFASLSFDGNVILNKVPTQHKYKIML